MTGGLARRRILIGFGGLGAFGLSALLSAALALDGPASLDQLSQLSIEQLGEIDVTSVSKTAQPLSTAPAAIYVITADEIRRSGAVTLPEILRLAPNLHVIQISASQYIITARGLSGNLADQNFSNKLLVLIDGRSVYTPMYSGVYWDMQDVVPADIERIEVISGPGATLWGANAVNGVINIITKSSGQTQGGLLDISAGNLEQSASLRYGGRISPDLTYRFYVRDYIGDDTETPSGDNAHDHWSKPQGGFRLDWTPSPMDSFTFQGDSYSGAESHLAGPREDIDGGNVLARWLHSWEDGSTLQVQAYFDQTARSSEQNNGDFWVDTYDIDVQHSFQWNNWNQISWGGGVRASHYQVNGTANLFFLPSSNTLMLANFYAQDTMSLGSGVSATAGLKLENDPYSGLAPLPNVRLSWQVHPDVLLWAAASRAIRAPTPFDVNVVELALPVTLTGWQDFDSEKLTAYEIGARLQPADDLSLSLSGFYNQYDELRSLELADGAGFHFRWGNGFRGETYGLEAWGSYQLTPWWRLSASLIELKEHFSVAPGNLGLLGVSQLGDDPERRASLQSSVSILPNVSFDTELRYVAHLPDPHVPSFVEMNARLGWDVTDAVRLSLSGFNLLHARHLEFPASEANAIPRSYAVGLQWRF